MKFVALLFVAILSCVVQAQATTNARRHAKFPVKASYERDATPTQLTAGSKPVIGATSSCSSNTDIDSCFAARASCHWDDTSSADGVCLSSKPATCSAFGRDALGCSTMNCAWNVDNERCYTLYVAPNDLCGQQTTAASCSMRHCFWDTYAPVPYASNGMILGYSDSSYSGSNLAVSSTYGSSQGACFPSLRASNAAYECIQWAHTSDFAHALDESCVSHACYSNDHDCSSTAYAMTAPATERVDVCYDIQNAQLDSSFQFLTVDVDIPIKDFFQPSSSTWYAIIMGETISQDNYAHLFTDSSVCNSISKPVALSTRLPPTDYTDIASLVLYFNQGVTNGDIQFTETTPDSRVMQMNHAIHTTIGTWKMGGSTDIISSTSPNVVQGTPSVRFHVNASLHTLVDSCGARHTTVDGTETFEIPISILTRQDNDNIAVATSKFKTSVSTEGALTISANSNAALSVSHGLVSDVQDTCAEGSKKRVYSIKLTYSNVLDSSRIVGIRSASDIITNSTTNCFHTVVTKVDSPTSCANSKCVSVVYFATECRALDPSGQTLNLCSNEGPSSLDYKHDFYDFPTSWKPTNAAASVISVSAVNMVPDFVSVVFNIASFPDSVDTNSNVVLVAGGFLTSGGFGRVPKDLIHTLPSTFFTTPELTVAIYTTNANAIDSVSLYINTSTIVFTPIDIEGRTLDNVPRLVWSDIQPLISTDFRSTIDANQCAGECHPIGAEKIHLGVDGFSLLVSGLQRLAPANGYNIALSWNALLVRPTSRFRMLAAGTQRAETGTHSENVYFAPKQAAASADPAYSQSTMPNPSTHHAANANSVSIYGTFIIAFGSYVIAFMSTVVTCRPSYN